MATTKTTARKSSSTTAAKKAAAEKKSPGKKAAATKSASKKTAPAAKTSKQTRKYSPSVGADVEREMREMKEGKLKSGRSDKKVTDPKQAIAIALSEARRAGKKVPPNPNQ